MQNQTFLPLTWNFPKPKPHTRHLFKHIGKLLPNKKEKPFEKGNLFFDEPTRLLSLFTAPHEKPNPRESPDFLFFPD